MEIIIKQNGKSVSLDSFDKQYNLFVRERLDPVAFGRLFDTIDLILYTWGDLDSHSNEEYSFLLKRMNIKNPQSIPARDAAHCLMAVAALSSSDTDDMQSTLLFIEPVVDFLNSLDNTTFCFCF